MSTTRCSACGQFNPQTQNFCGECGASLSSAVRADRGGGDTSSYTPHYLAQGELTTRFAFEGERKLLTVLFCDIANSTQLAARIGADAMHSLLGHFFDLALTEIHAVEGTVNQFLGDGFMALFGAPVAHEDHARRALTAAVSLRSRLHSSVSKPLHDLRVRMGVHTGHVVVGMIGDKLRLDYTAIGDTTNLAARLQQNAQPDVILVSEATQRSAHLWFDFRSIGRPLLKGIPEAPEVFILLGARSPRGATPSHTQNPHEMVGRVRELSLLSRSLEKLAAGQGSIVIVRGEAGVGKSRLVAEATRASAMQRWVEGRALSFGRKLSYWPFISILKTWFGIDDNDSEATAWTKLEQAAQELFAEDARAAVPYLATVLSLPVTGEHEQRVRYLDARGLGSQVLLNMRELFERQARRSPQLIVMEDWHWVDNSSVALCEHLLPLVRSSAICFWFVTRSEPGEPAARILAAARAQPELALCEVSLAPLASAESESLIYSLVGPGALTAAARSAILRRTEGNPFFIEEIIRSLMADGSLVHDSHEDRWRTAKPIDATFFPATVHDVIVARIDRLDEAVKSVLNLASVIGRTFLLRVLKAIGDVNEKVDAGLVQLELAELVKLRQQIPELEYIFKHALVQEAAYASILVERRRTIHRSVARAIETLFGERIDEFTGLLAYHFALGEEWDKARDYLFKAGDQAGRMAADAEALDYYRQAEEAYLRVAGAGLAPLERATLDRKLGQALYGVGRYDEAVAHFSRALLNLGIRYPSSRLGVRASTVKFFSAHFTRTIASKLMPPRKLNLDVAQEISTICQSLAWLDFFVDEERFGLDSLIELYAGERSDDVVARVRGLGTLSVVLMMLGALGLARRRIDEAVALALQSGQPAAVGGALFVRGWLGWIDGAPDLGRQSLQESAAAYRAVGDIRRWGGPTYFMCWIALQRAEFSSASKFAAELIRVGEDSGDPHMVTWGLTARGAIEMTAGPLEDAIGCFIKVRQMCMAISSFRTQSDAAGLLGMCLMRQQKLVEAEKMVLEAVELVQSHNLRGHWSCDPLNAYAQLRLLQAERCPISQRAGAIGVARKACTRALRCARDAATWLPETKRLLGILAHLRGDTRSMQVHWNASLEISGRLALPVQRARTLLEVGLRLGDRQAVDQAVQELALKGAIVDLDLARAARASRWPDAANTSQEVLT
ncbi:adenylate/guanylate cyclase domain-containing protein [Variovorax ureilyticus]|uniref:Adenylate/guanylate cyclase domain-containing protein n=1 Tax=Variovorax ureilyticus TaxID=1836198 RepID=A0ABU8VPL6_9BURK